MLAEGQRVFPLVNCEQNEMIAYKYITLELYGSSQLYTLFF